MNYIYSARDPSLPSLLCVSLFIHRGPNRRKRSEPVAPGKALELQQLNPASHTPLGPSPSNPVSLIPQGSSPSTPVSLILQGPSPGMTRHSSRPESETLPEAAVDPMVVLPLPGGGSQLFQVVFEHCKLSPPAASQQSRLSVGEVGAAPAWSPDSTC